MPHQVPVQHQLKPAHRKLRAYAFDPSLSIQLDTAVINNITYKVPWEELRPGPVGEYIEVIDYDPSGDTDTEICIYQPVDLNNQYVLAQDGLDPSEANPMFHQQMVYAVAMTTIRNFERALGRKIQWSSRFYHKHDQNGKRIGIEEDFVRRLRIYPHALREPNAYYSPLKKALLFGYFSSMPVSPGAMMPGQTIYTCLSHDIIAHEITHALLDGMHRRYVEATHLDSLAFHEAFADIVALFQHFTFPEVLKSQIAKTRGNLAGQNLLGQLAQEFGKAIGHYGSLRDALGKYNPETKIWEPQRPDPSEYSSVKEPHDRGAILVATVFDMFLSIYRKRIADLQRIASGGTGNIPDGSLHPDLVNRMAKEASKTAGHVLNMCIRALDYCPPVDINFGDYLRALITSDFDLVEDDELEYRIAIIEAFQKRGIYPDGLTNISVDGLLLKADEISEDFDDKFATLIEFFRKFKEKISYVTDREELFRITKEYIGGVNGEPGLHHLLHEKFQNRDEFGKLAGIIVNPLDAETLGVQRSKAKRTKGMPSVEVHNLKLCTRVGPSGKVINQIIVTITQKRGVVAGQDQYGNPRIHGFFTPGDPKKGWYARGYKGQKEIYTKERYPGKGTPMSGAGSELVLPDGWFVFRGGCTLIFDLDYSNNDSVKLKYCIRKRIDNEQRMLRQYKMLYQSAEPSLNSTYFGSAYQNMEAEPFAIIHKVL